MHIRQQIRNYVVGRLNNVTSAGARVYDSRTLESTDFPMINLATLRERFLEVFNQSPFEVRLSCELEIQAIVKISDTFAADLDNLCEQIESRMDMTLGGLVEVCAYNSTDIIFLDDQEVQVAIAKIIYNAEYLKPEGTLVDTSSDLNIIHVDYDLTDPAIGPGPGPDGQIDATDIVSV